MSHSVLETILESKVIAIVRGIPSGQISDLASAIRAGGLRCIEVTFDHAAPGGLEDTLAAIRALRDTDMCVGAGTVMSPEELAKEAGASYIISPNTNPAVIRETKSIGLVSIPGAMTPSEVAEAWSLGADLVKLFPAGVLGPAYIKAVKAPLKHIPVTAVGGVTPENTPGFLSAGCAGVGVGGNLVSPKLVSEGRWEEITAAARAYAEAVR